jgi:hypothetical protein
MPVVIKTVLGPLVAIFVTGLNPVLAADTSATVTEVFNQVSHGSAQASGTSPAQTGTHIQDGEYLKTGVKSRAELSLANQSITRLGANTIFNYSVANNEIDLQSGTILFSKPKDGKEMIIKTAAVTAAIVGTTGFAQAHGKALLFGLIEGHATLNVGGVSYPIGPGELLRLGANGKPELCFFNLPRFLATSPLITKFHSSLPNQLYIDKEVAKYNDFVGRGFVEPPTEPFFISDIDGSVPIVPIPARDSAGAALAIFNTPPPPPPASTNLF